MRSRIYHIVCLWSLLFGLCSCSEQELENSLNQKVLELKLSCIAPNTTRAEDGTTQVGEAGLNENKISTLHYFFYHSGKTSENAVLWGTTDIEDVDRTATIRIGVNDAEVNEVLFPRPATECELYVIANLPAGVTIPANDTKLDNLKSLVVELERTPENNLEKYSFDKQSSFVMDGLGKATLIDRNKTLAARAEIPLDRLAAKFTIRISASAIEVGGATWKPQMANLEVSMSHAESQSTLGATSQDQLFDYAKRNTITPATEDEKTWYAFKPFYSFPRQWDYKSEDAVAFDIMLPWKKEGGTVTPYYYRVYPNTMQLARNNWYHIDLNLGMLGSANEEDVPVEIKDVNYKVINWNNGTTDWGVGMKIETTLPGARYLIVDQNEYIVNNKDKYTIPFITSHTCVIKDLKVTVPDYSDEEEGIIDLSTKANSEKWLTIQGNQIHLNHALNNDFVNTEDYDYAPYTFTFTLCHADAENQDKFKEEITIVQNPAIIIEACLNSDYAADSDNKGGFQFINGTASNASGNGSYGGAWGLRGSNTNPNMYVITTTVLPAGSGFILGDPREVESTNPLSTNAVPAPGVEGGDNRRLSWYHQTLTDASVQNMISPKFRIASSYGVTNQITHTNAINRAASYQEDGYPAGRWRVPTMAEVAFIIKLSSDGKIPELFSEGSAYWCANGKVTPKDGGGYDATTGTSGNGPVRCVYDDWYWEKTAVPRLTDKEVFTWGDMSTF